MRQVRYQQAAFCWLALSTASPVVTAAQCGEIAAQLSQGQLPADAELFASCLRASDEAISEPLKLLIVNAVENRDAPTLLKVSDLFERARVAGGASSGRPARELERALIDLVHDERVSQVMKPFNWRSVDDVAATPSLLYQAARSIEEDRRYREIAERLDRNESGLSVLLDDGLANLWLYAYASAIFFLALSALFGTGLFCGYRRQLRQGHLLEGLAQVAGALTATRGENPSEDQRASPQFEALEERLSRRLADIEQYLAKTIERLEWQDRSLTEAHTALPTPIAVEDSASASAEFLNRLISLERQVLGFLWSRFSETYSALLQTMRALPGHNDWHAVRDRLLVDLPRALELEADLKAACDRTLRPLREFDSLMSRLALIPRLLDAELPPLSDRSKELFRLRECSALLSSLHNDERARIKFDFEKWIVSDFNTFAHLVNEYSREGRGSLQEAQGIIREILSLVAPEPDGNVNAQSGRGNHVATETASHP